MLFTTASQNFISSWKTSLTSLRCENKYSARRPDPGESLAGRFYSFDGRADKYYFIFRVFNKKICWELYFMIRKNICKIFMRISILWVHYFFIRKNICKIFMKISMYTWYIYKYHKSHKFFPKCCPEVCPGEIFPRYKNIRGTRLI